MSNKSKSQELSAAELRSELLSRPVDPPTLPPAAVLAIHALRRALRQRMTDLNTARSHAGGAKWDVDSLNWNRQFAKDAADAQARQDQIANAQHRADKLDAEAHTVEKDLKRLIDEAVTVLKAHEPFSAAWDEWRQVSELQAAVSGRPFNVSLGLQEGSIIELRYLGADRARAGRVIKGETVDDPTGPGVPEPRGADGLYGWERSARRMSRGRRSRA